MTLHPDTRKRIPVPIFQPILVETYSNLLLYPLAIKLKSLETTAVLGLNVVEAKGIEPLSETISTGTSPGAVSD